MSTEVIMPQMGESIVEGTITKWLKKVGEKVSRDEPLFEISTDKVDSEIPAPATGVVSEIRVPEGQTVQINTVVAVIDGENEAAGAALPGPAEPAAEAAERPVPPAPPPSEQPPAEARPAAPEAAPVVTAEARKAVAAPPRPAPVSASAGDVRTSPLVRRLAREHGVDLSQVRGSGLSGRITKQDLMEFIEAGPDATAEASPPGQEPQPARSAVVEIPVAAVEAKPATEAFRFAGEFESIPLTTMRRAIADHMVLSRRTSAHVNTVFEVDVTPIVRLREAHKVEFERREGTKLTFTPFIVKALVDTVREFPILNCSLAGDNIIYKKPVNVGIAVALETGLIVPVVKDAHLKSFTGIAVAVADLAKRARTKKLRPDDVQNGTISITNPGIYGSLFGTPIINQPQVAILGVGGVEKRPVVVGDAIAIRSMVYLSLSFDHRVIDGAVADQAMARLKERLQAWTQWVD